jgi:hypothetical protein
VLVEEGGAEGDDGDGHEGADAVDAADLIEVVEEESPSNLETVLEVLSSSKN